MKQRTSTRTSHFYPNFIAHDVADIDFDYLAHIGIKALCIDLDSTLLEHGTITVDETTQNVIKQQPLPVFIATNRHSSSAVKDIGSDIGAIAIMAARRFQARKPSPLFYQYVSEISGYPPREMVMVGDKLLQDVWGANRSGLTTIMVDKFGKLPVHEHIASWTDKLYLQAIRKHYQSLPSRAR